MNKIRTTAIVQWMISLGLPMVVLVFPTTTIFTEQMRLYLAITILGILFWAFGNVKQTIVAFILPWAYVLSGIATADVVFRPWTMPTLWMFIGSFFLINALNRCGLLKRISYKIIILFGGSYHGIFIGLGILGMILAMITGGVGTIPMLAVAMGINQALNFEKFSKEATGIFLAAALGGAIPGYVFYNSTTIMMLAIGSAVGGPETIGWFEHLLLGVPLIVYYILSIVLVAIMFRSKMKANKLADNKQYFIEQYQKLGKISTAEIKSSVVIILMLVFMMSATIIGIDASYGFIIFPLLLYLPGMNVGTEDDLKDVDLGFILFVATCLGIGMTGVSLGFGNLVTDLLLPLLQGQSVWLYVGAVWLVGFIMNFLLTPMAIFASFSGPLAALAMSLDINPLATYFLLFFGADQVIFPYECALYLIFFSYGVIKMSDFIKYFSVRAVLSLIVLFAVAVPFYQLIGYLYL